MDLDTAPIRDIRGIMTNLNVSAVGCVSRDDLKAKLIENVPELRRAMEEKRAASAAAAAAATSPIAPSYSYPSGVNNLSDPLGLTINILFPC